MSGNSKDNRRIRRAIEQALSKILPLRQPEPEKPKLPGKSILRRIFDWEGFSFVFLSTIGLALIATADFNTARWLFVLAAMAGAIKFTNEIAPPQTKYRLVFAVMASMLAAIGVNRVNGWVTAKEIAANVSEAHSVMFVIRQGGDSSAARPSTAKKEHALVDFLPIAAVNPPTLVLNSQIPLNLQLVYQNAGSFPVHNASCRGKLYVRDQTLADEKEIADLFEKTADFNNFGLMLVNRGDKRSCGTERLITAEEIQDIQHGKRLFVLAGVRYRDDSGRYERQLCEFSYIVGNEFSWHMCGPHNDEVQLH